MKLRLLLYGRGRNLYGFLLHVQCRKEMFVVLLSLVTQESV